MGDWLTFIVIWMMFGIVVEIVASWYYEVTVTEYSLILAAGLGPIALLCHIIIRRWK